MDKEVKLNEIAQRIKQRRIDLGLSLQNLADLTDMSKSTLQRYENGSIKNIPLHKLGILAKSLQTSADWLLGWVDSPNEYTSLDIDVKTLLEDLGYSIETYPHFTTIDFLSKDGNGGGAITTDEFYQLRDEIISFAQNSADKLIIRINKRDSILLKDSTEKFRIFADALNSGKDFDTAFSEAMQHKNISKDDE